MIKEPLAKLVERIDLEEEEIMDVANLMMQGELSDAEISAFLVALRMKGETIQRDYRRCKITYWQSKKNKNKS